VAAAYDTGQWHDFSPAALTASLAVVGAVGTMTTSVGGLYWLAAAMTTATRRD